MGLRFGSTANVFNRLDVTGRIATSVREAVAGSSLSRQRPGERRDAILGQVAADSYALDERSKSVRLFQLGVGVAAAGLMWAGVSGADEIFNNQPDPTSIGIFNENNLSRGFIAGASGLIAFALSPALLGNARHMLAIEGLSQNLLSDDPKIREEAALALHVFGSAVVIDVQERLVRLIETTRDESLLKKAVRALVKLLPENAYLYYEKICQREAGSKKGIQKIRSAFANEFGSLIIEGRHHQLGSSLVVRYLKVNEDAIPVYDLTIYNMIKHYNGDKVRLHCELIYHGLLSHHLTVEQALELVHKFALNQADSYQAAVGSLRSFVERIIQVYIHSDYASSVLVDQFLVGLNWGEYIPAEDIITRLILDEDRWQGLKRINQNKLLILSFALAKKWGRDGTVLPVKIEWDAVPSQYIGLALMSLSDEQVAAVTGREWASVGSTARDHRGPLFSEAELTADNLLRLVRGPIAQMMGRQMYSAVDAILHHLPDAQRVAMLDIIYEEFPAHREYASRAYLNYLTSLSIEDREDADTPYSTTIDWSELTNISFGTFASLLNLQEAAPAITSLNPSAVQENVTAEQIYSLRRAGPTLTRLAVLLRDERFFGTPVYIGTCLIQAEQFPVSAATKLKSVAMEAEVNPVASQRAADALYLVARRARMPHQVLDLPGILESMLQVSDRYSAVAAPSSAGEEVLKISLQKLIRLLSLDVIRSLLTDNTTLKRLVVKIFKQTIRNPFTGSDTEALAFHLMRELGLDELRVA
jgi:hypothetical protein